MSAGSRRIRPRSLLGLLRVSGGIGSSCKSVNEFLQNWQPNLAHLKIDQ
jgi:hypothetical protein